MPRKPWLYLLMIAPLAGPAHAADDTAPEIERPVAPPQAVGEVHALRTIPEACARIEGVFTGNATEPYRFAVLPTHSNCQPRARFVDTTEVGPDTASGWIFNDLIRIPSEACPSQHALVRVWRKPGSAAPLELDAQGRVRIYLQESKQTAGGAASKLPLFTAAMAVEGEACEN